MPTSLLRLDSSALGATSVTRQLTDRIVARFPGAAVTVRDVAADPIPLVDEAWITARTLPEAERTPAQRDLLALSDALIAEVVAADVLVIGVPIYNFGVPASLKAWIDQVSRVGVTFRYTETGPVGLLADRPTYLAVASGGTAAGSEGDYAARYMTYLLGFLGIRDVTTIAADQLAIDPEGTIARAMAAADALTV